jgi:hypothetical protein
MGMIQDEKDNRTGWCSGNILGFYSGKIIIIIIIIIFLQGLGQRPVPVQKFNF